MPDLAAAPRQPSEGALLSSPFYRQAPRGPRRWSVAEPGRRCPPGSVTTWVSSARAPQGDPSWVVCHLLVTPAALSSQQPGSYFPKLGHQLQSPSPVPSLQQGRVARGTRPAPPSDSGRRGPRVTEVPGGTGAAGTGSLSARLVVRLCSEQWPLDQEEAWGWGGLYRRPADALTGIVTSI